MGMDVDYIIAKSAIERLEKILFDLEHSEREEISDDIIEFVEKMKTKYKQKNDTKRRNN